MNKLKPSRVFFIKLGAGGTWNRECIEERQIVKVGFVEISHELPQYKKWDEVRSVYTQRGDIAQNVGLYVNQLRTFYESGEDVLWITFWNDKMWWAFAEKEVYSDSDGTKYRKVKGQWRSEDVHGKILHIDNLSGQLTKVQGYRSTLCGVDVWEYAVRKINGEEMPEFTAANEDLSKLRLSIGQLIKRLQPGDFEVLIDLIFRELGCSRISIVGSTQKTKDIAFMAPVTGEKYVVQIKSSASLQTYLDYEQQFLGWDYDRYYFVVHSPSPELEKFKPENDQMRLWKLDEISSFVINAGLTDWLITKVS